jgi:hypothetical protein
MAPVACFKTRNHDRRGKPRRRGGQTPYEHSRGRRSWWFNRAVEAGGSAATSTGRSRRMATGRGGTTKKEVPGSLPRERLELRCSKEETVHPPQLAAGEKVVGNGARGADGLPWTR